MPADFLSAAGTVLVVSVVTPMIMKAIAPKDIKSIEKDGYFSLDYSKGYYAAMYVTMTFFAGLTVFAYFNPGKTKPETMVWVLLVFAFFAGLSLFTLIIMKRGMVTYNQEEVIGSDSFGKRNRIKWQDLSAVDYIAWAQGFKLKSKSGEVIWVSPSMQGFADFYNLLVDKAQDKIQGNESEN